jgi:phosphonate degradation associated HDIG domain protein
MPVAVPQFVKDALDQRGHQFYGEAVSQAEHMLLCAHKALLAGEDEPMILAALLHDFGHLLEDAETAPGQGIDAQHEAVGAAYLSRYFAPSITRPIALHVAAKRYLCQADPDYLGQLSAASLLSLKLQGSPFTAQEAQAFKGEPFSAEAVRLRRYDECGKTTGVAVPSLDAYGPMLNRHLVNGL